MKRKWQRRCRGRGSGGGGGGSGGGVGSGGGAVGAAVLAAAVVVGQGLPQCDNFFQFIRKTECKIQQKKATVMGELVVVALKL